MTAEQAFKQNTSSAVQFEVKLFKIDSWIILKLPDSASKKLPSRGQIMVDGIINGHYFQTALEPDGNLSHWFKVDADLIKAANANMSDRLKLTIKPSKTWPEPDVPTDLIKALKNDSKAYGLWQLITPMARWEWIRWIRSTNVNETRIRRIEVACSKLSDGKRRPCCWNRNLSTEPKVSKNGVLLEQIHLII